MHVIVIGSGIAGIAATHALRRLGLGVSLLERDREARGSGYQMNILPNGRYALERIGLLDALDAPGDGWPLLSAESVDGTTGRTLTRAPEYPEAGRYAAASYYRGDVHRALLAGLSGDGPRFGCGVAKVDDPPNGPVRVTCADGRELAADLVVLADGARSRIRSQLFGGRYDLVPRLTGVLAAARIDLAGDSEAERLFRNQAERREFTQVLLPGGGAVMSFASGGRIGVGVFGRYRQVPSDLSGSEARELALNLARHSREPRLAHALERACWDAEDPERAPAVGHAGDIDPLPAFARGRIALVGDCAHAMFPVLGQGANQGLEDAMVLASRLAAVRGLRAADQPAAIRDALKRYSDERLPHVASIQTEARRRLRLMLSRRRWQHRAICALMPRLPRALDHRHRNKVNRYAIADARCPIERLDRRGAMEIGTAVAGPS